jgi:AraC-like DNA-binding protein
MLSGLRKVARDPARRSIRFFAWLIAPSPRCDSLPHQIAGFITGSMEREVVLQRRPLLNCSYQEFRDPADLCHAYRTLNPHIREFIDLAPGNTFRHWVGGLMVNGTPLVAGIVTRTRVCLGDSPDLALIVMHRGVLDLCSRTGTVAAQAGGIVLAPMAGNELELSGARCAIRLQPAAIARAAVAMAGRGSGGFWRSRHWSEQLTPICLQAGHPQARVIHGLIRTIDRCFAVGAQVAKRLGLDDQIHRVAASLLQPELLSEEPRDLGRLRERGGRIALDELIDYIRANLDQPLPLSNLEARSHYSRRALQYAFQDRFACSPKQWIREQRLALALEQLQADGHRPTVRHVALACGYLSSSHFCSDFKRRYGITPAQASRL